MVDLANRCGFEWTGKKYFEWTGKKYIPAVCSCERNRWHDGRHKCSCGSTKMAKKP
jgi:hypothetical protein